MVASPTPRKDAPFPHPILSRKRNVSSSPPPSPLFFCLSSCPLEGVIFSSAASTTHKPPTPQWGPISRTSQAVPAPCTSQTAPVVHVPYGAPAACTPQALDNIINTRTSHTTSTVSTSCGNSVPGISRWFSSLKTHYPES